MTYGHRHRPAFGRWVAGGNRIPGHVAG